MFVENKIPDIGQMNILNLVEMNEKGLTKMWLLLITVIISTLFY